MALFFCVPVLIQPAAILFVYTIVLAVLAFIFFCLIRKKKNDSTQSNDSVAMKNTLAFDVYGTQDKQFL